MTGVCHSCRKPLDSVIATVTFSGFEKERLNGQTLYLHGRCLRLEPTERNIALLPRIHDATADTDLVMVYLDEGEWTAFCRECHKIVGQKDTVDNAHLMAAMHIARVHARAEVSA